MSKGLRLVVTVIFVLGVLLLARGQMAWAGALPAWNFGAVVQNPAAANAAAPDAPGTVKPPPVVAPPISGPGTYSVGGVCTFRVIQLATSITLHADLLPFATLGKQPDNIASYLAGVCRAMYVKVGAGVIDALGSDGEVQICFAAVPNTTGKIYVYNDKTWTGLTTTSDNGLECAPAQQTGKYVLVTEKP